VASGVLLLLLGGRVEVCIRAHWVGGGCCQATPSMTLAQKSVFVEGILVLFLKEN